MDFKQQLKPLKNYAGMYGWYHEKTNRMYVGSAECFYTRPCRHLYPSVKTNKYLKNALKKYPLTEFTLVILEVLNSTNNVTKSELENAENKFFKVFPKKYNILEKAFTSFGYVHTEEARKKLSEMRKGIPLSEETKKKLSILFSGENNPFLWKKTHGRV
jgi:group I intron endonuclease